MSIQRFFIVNNEIVPPSISNLAAGAIVTFEGRVRNHNDGRSVERLYYESYDELAISEGNRIIDEAIVRFSLEDMVAIHRIGELQLGDTAIWIQSCSAHRKNAFEACEWAMDQIKQTVPIWKREEYTDGKPEWLRGEPKIVDSTERHLRQIMLPEIGVCGQEKLSGSNVLILGAGGLGTPALEYLARAGIGSITLVEPDRVEESNLGRQIQYLTQDIGRLKIDVINERLNTIDSRVNIYCSNQRFSSDNAESLINGKTLVLDCMDDLEAKAIASDFCTQLKIPLISSSIHKWQGQLLVVDGGPCLRCQWDSLPASNSIGTCEEEGILGTVSGFFGILQANEAIKVILGFGTLSHSLLAVDLRDYSVFHIERSQNPGCPGCQNGQNKVLSESQEISLEEMQFLDSCIVVDLQGNREDIVQFLGIEDRLIVDSIKEAESKNPRAIVLICARGKTSQRKAQIERERGRKNVFSLKGGISELSRRV